MRLISTPNAPAPGGAYSQAVSVDGMLYTAGQVGADPTTGERPADYRAEVRQALANLGAVIEAGGSSVDRIVRTMCLITDVADFTVFNEEYAAFFGDHRPARSTFSVGLAGGYRFEIEAIAKVEGQ
ncbi:MAG: RidA family protein [Actinomycetota bacterium]